MIELYRQEADSEGDWVEAELHAMVVGYQRVVLSPRQAVERFGPQVRLPVLVNGERTVSGRDSLLVFLRELEKFAEDWYLYQGDACYIREDRNVC